jgi:hypothetical protein
VEHLIRLEAELVDGGERRFRASDLAQCDGPVEGYNGGGPDHQQLVVQREDLTPVRGLDGPLRSWSVRCAFDHIPAGLLRRVVGQVGRPSVGNVRGGDEP